ncbi:CBS domain-containing protein [Salinirarus marinus]|uniref:CBS domain-containing protein n=1 Tax=Salinirarus marinus TaxID=3068310 RepID=UPI003C6C8288
MIVPVPVSDVMATDVVTVSPDETAREAARRFREEDVGSLVVAGEDGRPVGIVADSDLVSLLADDRPLETTVSEFMSTDLVTASASEPIEDAARRMRDHGVDQLPVLDGDDLAGLVSVRLLSYYLPQVLLRQVGAPDSDVEDWEFTYSDESEAGLDVGDVATFSKTLSVGDVERFARASGDTNPLHLDADYARETRFGRRIVHGVLALGVVSAALARLPGLVVYLSQSVQFVAPVDVGDTVTARCEVIERLGKNRYRLETTVSDGDGVVVEGEATVLVDPSSPEETGVDVAIPRPE